jgi:hypothetical protein
MGSLWVVKKASRLESGFELLQLGIPVSVSAVEGKYFDLESIRYISIRAAQLFSNPGAPHSATPELLQLL